MDLGFQHRRLELAVKVQAFRAPAFAVLILAFATLLPAPSAHAQAERQSPEQRKEAFAKLPWQAGPANGTVGQKASLAIPASARLLPEASGARFLELTGNLPQPGQTILVKGDWWAVFSFSDVGFVKDDEKLDADALLKSLQDSDGPGNEERKKRGIPTLRTEGWAVPPHFDAATKRLEWGLRLRAEGEPQPVINYTVRVLGRTGYESVTLVSDADSLDKDVADLKEVLKGFIFNTGERYAEFKAGDRVAEIGLGALVLGGAAAAAAKSGWFKGLFAALLAGWKFVAAAAVAAMVGLGKLLNRKKSS
jgi:uncharacterized membrane-anchored protein